MSRIYLHQENGEEVEISGSERHHMAQLSERVALAALSFWCSERHWIQDLLPADAFGNDGPMDHDRARSALGMMGASELKFAGKTYSTWDTMLNTAMALGSDGVRLCARIHAQCEIWLRVEGNNRAWLADLCQKTLDAGIFREGMGWPKAIEMLRSDDKSPVVFSYSVCEQFPASSLWKFDTEEEREAWCEKPYAERWKEALEVIRARDEGNGWTELRPEGFSDYRFGHGMDLLKLQELVLAEKNAATK